MAHRLLGRLDFEQLERVEAPLWAELALLAIFAVAVAAAGIG